MKRTARIAVMLLAMLGVEGRARAQGLMPGPLVPVPLTPGGSVARLEPPPYDEPPLAVLAEQAAADDRERFWGYADYLFGWFRSQSLPPLVTTSLPGTALVNAGLLTNPNTRVLFGGTPINDNLRSGTNFGFGCWLDGPKTLGVDFGFMYLGSQTTAFATNSDQNPILARPFFNALTNKQASQIVAFPGRATGSISASDSSESFYGAHMDFQEIFLADRGYRFMSVFGYQFFGFNDRLQIDQNVKSLGGSGVVAGTQFATQDLFDTENRFHGLDLGLKGEFFFWQRFYASLLAKVALGDVHRVVAINGISQITAPGQAPIVSQGGLLALSSNSGTYHLDQFTAVPQLGATFGWNVTNWCRLHVGYSVLFLNDMARAGDQVSLNVNPNLFPPQRAPLTPTVPAFNLMKSDFSIQTINLGIDFRY